MNKLTINTQDDHNEIMNKVNEVLKSKGLQFVYSVKLDEDLTFKLEKVNVNKESNENKKYRGWYTHNFFVLTLEKIKKLGKRLRMELSDPPTLEEIQEIYQETFSEMSDPWEVTANGRCKVVEIKEKKSS